MKKKFKKYKISSQKFAFEIFLPKKIANISNLKLVKIFLGKSKNTYRCIFLR
jgi:hypothetical protein